MLSTQISISTYWALLLPIVHYKHYKFLRIWFCSCNIMYGTPTTYIDMLNHPLLSNGSLDLTSLESGLCGAAPCPVPLMQNIIHKLHISKLLVRDSFWFPTTVLCTVFTDVKVTVLSPHLQSWICCYSIRSLHTSGWIRVDGVVAIEPCEQVERLDSSTFSLWWTYTLDWRIFWSITTGTMYSRWAFLLIDNVILIFQVRTSTIGCTLDHLESKIIDPKGQVVPIGEQGEICVRGYSVMHGYWDDEAQTRQVP